VVADIPGLIEGAHEGAGLGTRFLRHVERCRLILHLVDPTSPERDPLEAIAIIRRELAQYDPNLAAKPEILVVTKIDSVQDDAALRRIRDLARTEGRPLLEISAVTGTGLDSLVHVVADELDRLATVPV
jgi:GTP-binding protein